MNPAQAFANRTARLVSEGAHKPRVAYTSATPAPVREHLTAVEIDDGGGRWWTTMPDSKVDDFCDFYDGMISDIDHSAKCWCSA